MNFLKSNWIALTMVFLTIMCEYFHMLFSGISFSQTVNLDAPVYYIVNSIGGTTLLTTWFIYLLTDKSKIESRAILIGVIGWNLIETWENICYLAGINKNVLLINSTAWTQLAFISMVVFGVSYGFSKSRY